MRLCCKSPFVILVLLVIISVPTYAQSKWQMLETFKYDWNGRGSVLFRIENSIPKSESGSFSRVRISVPGEKEFAVVDNDGLVSPFDKESWIPKKLRSESKGLIRSGNVLVLREAEGADSKTLVVLIGYAYASSPGALWVIRLGESGPPYVAFHKKEMGLTDFVDLDGDGTKEIVGYPCLSQQFGSYLVTYDPIKVFSIAQLKAEYSLSLSEKYNREHYVWAGPECSEKFAVMELPGKKRRVYPIREAERLDAEALKKLGPNPKRSF